jgi:Reverse transcriptase (RNA-dependent DNA polymerase)/Endonuclease-reverse transcriptase
MSATDAYISVCQLNMNGQRIASVQLLEYCRKNGVDVLLLQEMPRSGRGIFGFEFDTARVILDDSKGRNARALAAIVVLNKDIEVVAIRNLMDRCFAVASLRKGNGGTVVFISAYFKYRHPTQGFTEKLGRILDVVGDNVVIGADVNAHSAQWFSRPGNNSGFARGTHVENLIGDQHLTVHNRPGCPETYSRRGMGSSNIDVTLSRGGGVHHSIQGWGVEVDVTDSDHNLLRFLVRCGIVLQNSFETRKRYNVKRADWDKFGRVLAQKVSENSNELEGNPDRASSALVSSIQGAMEASMPKSRTGGRSKPSWWSEDLTRSKKKLLAFRRRSDFKGVDRPEYKRLRNEHLFLIRKAKSTSWRCFADSANDNVWGPLYKWARNGPAMSRVPNSVRSAGGEHTVSAAETAECFLNELIPRDGTCPIFDGFREGRSGPALLESEVKKAIWRMAPNKAPGLDGITAAVLRKSWPVVGPHFTRILDRCLRASTFPDSWKTANVVVISKGADRDPCLPKSYRPVSLLSAPSKVLERLIVTRLEDEIRLNMSEDQHGFTVGRSTVSAIRNCLDWVDGAQESNVVGIFLDISGAFDNLGWKVLIRDMVGLGASPSTRTIVESYLTGRTAVLTVERSTASVRLTRGCPQGSQLGPVLWKMSMEYALRIDRDDRIKVVAYADDIAVLVSGTSLGEIQTRAGNFLAALLGWAGERGLTFSSGKSQALVLKGNLPSDFTVPFGNDEIVSTERVRYLGLILDRRRNYWAHVQTVAGKSEELYSRLRTATSANWGIRQATSRVIYGAVFLPRITYASEIWRNGLKTGRAIRLLGSKQRRALLSITGAYRTVSTDALQVVAGQLPLDLEVEWNAVRKGSRSQLYSATEVKELREKILDTWQDRWNRSDKGRWTFSMMPDVRRRLSLPLQLDHYTTQFLTGHGDFNAKLDGFRLREGAGCSCGLGDETVEHVLFECSTHEEERVRLRNAVIAPTGTWPCPTSVFLDTRSNYQALVRFSKAVLMAKKESE